MVFFDNDCNECWQLDCFVDRQFVEGLDVIGKDMDVIVLKCDDGVKFFEKWKECKEQLELLVSIIIIVVMISDGGVIFIEMSIDDDKDDLSNDKGNEEDVGFCVKSFLWIVLVGGVFVVMVLIVL